MLILAGIRLLRVLITFRYTLQIIAAIKEFDDFDSKLLEQIKSRKESNSSNKDVLTSNADVGITPEIDKKDAKLMKVKREMVFDCLSGLCAISLVFFFDFRLFEMFFSWFPGYYHIKAIALILVAFPELGISNILICDIFLPLFCIIEVFFGLPNYPVTMCTILLYAPLIIAVVIFPPLAYSSKTSIAVDEKILNDESILEENENSEGLAASAELDSILAANDDSSSSETSSSLIQEGLKVTARRLSTLSKVILEAEQLVLHELKEDSTTELLEKLAAETIDVIGMNEFTENESSDTYLDQQRDENISDMTELDSEPHKSFNLENSSNNEYEVDLKNRKEDTVSSTSLEKLDIEDEIGDPLDIACNDDDTFIMKSPKKEKKKILLESEDGYAPTSLPSTSPRSPRKLSSSNSNVGESKTDSVKIEIERRMSSSRLLTLSVVQSLVVDDIYNSVKSTVAKKLDSDVSSSKTSTFTPFKTLTTAISSNTKNSTNLNYNEVNSNSSSSKFRKSFMSFRSGTPTPDKAAATLQQSTPTIASSAPSSRTQEKTSSNYSHIGKVNPSSSVSPFGSSFNHNYNSSKSSTTEKENRDDEVDVITLNYQQSSSDLFSNVNEPKRGKDLLSTSKKLFEEPKQSSNKFGRSSLGVGIRAQAPPSSLPSGVGGVLQSIKNAMKIKKDGINSNNKS